MQNGEGRHLSSSFCPRINRTRLRIDLVYHVGVSNRWNGIWNGTVNVCSYS